LSANSTLAISRFLAFWSTSASWNENPRFIRSSDSLMMGDECLCIASQTGELTGQDKPTRPNNQSTKNNSKQGIASNGACVNLEHRQHG
jgi:hypothetical protein